MNWIKHFVWFIKESKHFLDCSYLSLIKKGGIRKAIVHANFMVKWDKLSPKQKEIYYLTEDRTIEFQTNNPIKE